LIWDSGASHCISNNKDDFVGPIKRAGWFNTKLRGLAKGLNIAGIGTVEWTVVSDYGTYRTLRLPCFYVPNSPVRLLGTSSLLQTYKGETIELTDQAAYLSGIEGDETRPPVTAFLNPSNNIPSCSAFKSDDLQAAVHHIEASMTAVVDPANINLSESEKELLRWHQRLGHMDYRKIQFLMRTGVLSTSQNQRAMHASSAKIRNPPKCAACQFGKQTTAPVKTKPTATGAPVADKPPVLKEGKLFPGQTVSVDHFVCSTKGVSLTSRGGAQAAKLSGGCIFVDNASGLTHVEHQEHLNTHETLAAKEKFEAMCRDHGVVPTEYVSDSGTAFTSKEFTKHLEEYRQHVSFAGTGAHHHNAVAERSIRTIMSIARTMMLHAAIHWPEMADATLWPLAVDYAVHVFNRVPNPETGLSPLDVFSNTRHPQRRLHDLHVWGSPAYLLDKRIADGKKIPRWQSKSERVIFVGISPQHTSTIPRVLNPRTRAITTPYHVVFDDWFATVGSDPAELPDFKSDEWNKLFGDSEYQYVKDESWADETTPEPTPEWDRMFQRREQVSQRMDSRFVPPQTTSSVSYDRFDVQPVHRPATRPATVAQRENLPETRTGQNLPPPAAAAPPPATAPPPADEPPPLLDSQDSDDDDTVADDDGSVATVDDEEDTELPHLVPRPYVDDSDDEDDDDDSSTDSIKRPNIVKQIQDHLKPGNKPSTPTRPKRERVRPKYFVEGNTFTIEGIEDVTFEISHDALLAIAETVDPEFYKASKSDPDTMTLEQALADTSNYDKWLEALDKEINSLEDMDVWDEIPESEATGPIVPTHWVMKIKRKPDGSLDKFKARLVVRGDLMKDFDFETHAPVCAWSTIRMMLILSITWAWCTCTCDYSSAFTHSTLESLDQPVFIRLPRGYKSNLPRRSCLRLKRSLYGTNFAPKLWFESLKKALLEYGLVQSEHDPCLFMKPGVMVCAYVDDLCMSFKDPKERDNFFAAMKKMGFTLTMDDTIESFLGIKFEKMSDGSYNLTQPALIEKIIQATGMEQCNASPTPAAPNTTLGKDPEGEPMKESWSYPSVIGMLLYLSTNTRSDITFAVSQVARFTHGPKQSHATAVKRIVRYLQGTRDKGMIMRPDGTLSVESYSDADFAGLYKVDPMEDPSSAKSRMGYIVKLSGCPLVWKSQLIDSICLATAEAEYYSLSHCLRTLLPILRVLKEVATNLDVATSHTPTITARAFEDNTAALSLANNQRLTSRTRYYHTMAHHFWEAVNNGVVQVVGIATNLMDADIFTKAKGRIAFEENRKRIQGW
jgi:hypothetical protein